MNFSVFGLVIQNMIIYQQRHCSLLLKLIIILSMSCYLKYFVYYMLIKLLEGNISFDFFMVLIGLFVFGTLEQQVKILLSACGIHSNVTLSRPQAINFLKQLNSELLKTPDLEELLAEFESTDTVYLPNILNFIRKAPIINVQFIVVKTSLINKFIGRHTFELIEDRIQYYHLLGANNIPISNSNSPESCCDVLTRILLRTPPPYYTDYPQKEDTVYSMDSFVRTVRNLYGYSKRPACSRKPTLSSVHSSRTSSRRNSTASSISISRKKSLNKSTTFLLATTSSNVVAGKSYKPIL